MDAAGTTYTHLRSASRQRNVLAVIALLLVLAVLIQAHLLSSKEERFVLVPTMHAETALTSRAPSPEYLEMMMRDTANLFLNRHPSNLSYFRENVLRMSHPSAHGELEAAILATEKRLIATETSTVFFPGDIVVNDREMFTEIHGRLHTYLGPERIGNEAKAYRADWSYESMRLWLLDFYPIEDGESQINEARLVTSGE